MRQGERQDVRGEKDTRHNQRQKQKTRKSWDKKGKLKLEIKKVNGLSRQILIIQKQIRKVKRQCG